MSEVSDMPIRPRLILFVLAFPALLAAPAARANMLVNGSFENGPALPSGKTTLTAGSTAMPGWTVSAGSIEIVNLVHWQAADLGRSLGLNGTEAGAVAQVFATATGGVYDVSFWISGEPGTLPLVKNLRVSAAGQSADFSFDSEHIWEWAMGWELKTWSFTAAGSSTELEFRSLDAGAASPALDHVTVTGPTVGVGEAIAGLRLEAPRPNPARGRVSIECSLPRAGRAEVAVLDLQGRVVAALAEGELPAGRHAFAWDAAARGAEPGLYFVRLTTRDATRTRRIALVR